MYVMKKNNMISKQQHDFISFGSFGERETAEMKHHDDDDDFFWDVCFLFSSQSRLFRLFKSAFPSFLLISGFLR